MNVLATSDDDLPPTQEPSINPAALDPPPADVKASGNSAASSSSPAVSPLATGGGVMNNCPAAGNAHDPQILPLPLYYSPTFLSHTAMMMPLQLVLVVFHFLHDTKSVAVPPNLDDDEVAKTKYFTAAKLCTTVRVSTQT
jgi:hypothetical protein